MDEMMKMGKVVLGGRRVNVDMERAMPVMEASISTTAAVRADTAMADRMICMG